MAVRARQAHLTPFTLAGSQQMLQQITGPSLNGRLGLGHFAVRFPLYQSARSPCCWLHPEQRRSEGVSQFECVLLVWVQAGYALEALAKGAMDLSRRFSQQELQERWRALLYDPAVAVEASRKLLAACGQAAVLGDLVSRPARHALTLPHTLSRALHLCAGRGAALVPPLTMRGITCYVHLSGHLWNL
jgi:hypothetical protein